MNALTRSRTRPESSALRSLGTLFRRISGLRGGEEARALRLGLGYALVLASMYVLKPARNSLFLSRIGAEHLPYVMVAVAVIGGGTAVLLASAAGALRVQRLTRLVFLGFAISLVPWWAALREQAAIWQVFLFYVWVNLYGQLATACTWLLAGAVVNARESRRVFAFVGAMGILGAVAGGVFTQRAAGYFGTINLLPLCLLLLLGAFCLLRTLGREELEAPRPRALPGHRGDLLEDVRRYRLLRVLLGMTLLAGVTSAIIDVQFNALVDESLPSEDEKTAFFGSFFAYLNAGAFLFQLVVTSRVMSRFGLGVALLALPAALGGGSLLVLLLPGLAAATALKASDAGLRHSLYRSGVELLFVPLPSAVKKRIRMFLDATVDNLGTGIGALLVLAVTMAVGVDHRYLALMALVVIAAWAWVAARARAAHVEAFRVALETRQIHPEELSLDVADPRVRAALRRALHSEHPRELSYALSWVRDTADPEILERLRELLNHPDGEVRARALSTLARQDPLPDSLDASRLLEDPEPDVRREAAVLMARMHGGPRDVEGECEVLRSLLDAGDPRVRAAALGAVADLGHAELLDFERVRSMLAEPGDDAEWARRELARGLGGARPSAEVSQLLEELSRDSSSSVARQAIQSAGSLRAPELLDLLIDQLGHRSTRAAALEAIVRHGPGAVPALVDALAEQRSVSGQLPLVRALSRLDCQPAVDALLGLMPDGSAALHHGVIQALHRLRRGVTPLRFSTELVRRELDTELAYAARLGRASRADATTGGTEAGHLLLRALREKRQETLERVFWLLGLIYPVSDMQNAFAAVRSDHPAARANALEFLDNVLAPGDRRRVLPLMESTERAHDGERRPSSPEPAMLRELMMGRDAWLRACAVFNAASDPELASAVAAALDDPEPVVREVASLSLSRMEAAC